jgi:transcriptional regulator with XRE-family HTH domain
LCCARKFVLDICLQMWYNRHRLSRLNQTRHGWAMKTENPRTFGETTRTLRKQRGEPLRVVAAAVEIDSTLLSKIERGERFPTEAQVAKFSEYFGVPQEELAAKAIADRIISEYGYQSATLQAIQIIKERMAPYLGERE